MYFIHKKFLKIKGFKLKEFSVLKISIFIIFICIFIELSLQSLEKLNLLSPEDIQIINPYKEVKLNLKNLKEGSYLISAGRPRGRCEILIDGISVRKNYSNSENRDFLFLSHGFLQSTSTPFKEAIVKCDKNQSNSLAQYPILQTHHIGLIIQSIREFSQNYFGVFSLFLGFILYFIFRQNGSLKRDRTFFIFMAMSSLYFFSLSHLFYLFLDSETSNKLHSFIRIFYVYSFLLNNIPKKNRNTSILIFSFLIILQLSFALNLKEEQYNLLYNYEIPLLGFVFLWVALKQIHKRDRESKWLTSLLIVYSLYHWNAYFYFINFKNVNMLGFLFPILIFSLLLLHKWTHYQFWLKLEKFNDNFNQFIRNYKDHDNCDDLFKEMAIRNFKNYLYHSIHKKLNQNQPLFSYENRKLIQAIPPQERRSFIKSYREKRDKIKENLEYLELRNGDRLASKIRSFYRGKDTELVLSLLMLDINNYSKQYSKYGAPYAQFIKEKFLKSLELSLSQCGGLLEAINGDELVILFIFPNHLSREEIGKRHFQILNTLDTFSKETQIALFSSDLFPQQTFSAGFSTEKGLLTKEEGKYFLKNAPNAKSRRIASAAASDSILIDDHTRQYLEYFGFSFYSEPFSILIKKDFIEVSEFNGTLQSESA